MVAPRRYGGYRGGWDRRGTGQLKPENALSRAAQLMQVGRPTEANQTLYDIITESQPRSRRQWTKTLESIMLKLMEYSVDLRKANMVKEALHKYRALCLATNVQSLEDVVRALIKLAEAKTEAARKGIDDAFAQSVVDDLEEGGTEAPETLLLEAAGAEQSRERSDRQVVVPWMKFLWEVYRVVLDIVKSHVKLEPCYHDMACQAFRFCLKYQRFMEFRRLCDMLRQHMQALIKTPTQRTPNDVLLLNPDTTTRYLETRFTQLQSAVELCHWQEAYRTVEDIHTLITMSKKAPRPQTMAIYYDNLMQVFWVSGNHLYHAHALYRLYTLSVKQNKNFSAEDSRMMASRLLLAALSIPVHEGGASSQTAGGGTGASADLYGSSSDLVAGENAARSQRMASLLGYSTPARRATLLTEIESKQILELCHDELKELYPVLETEMTPLQLSKRLEPIFKFIDGQEILKEYGASIRRVAIYRLLEQLSRVYDVMRLSDVERVVGFTDIAEVERVALEALKTRSLGVRFDHQKKCLRFETALFDTEAMRSQLGAMSRRLASAIKMIKESDIASSSTGDELPNQGLIRRAAAIQMARDYAVTDQEAILARKAVIEERRIEHEKKVAAAEKEAKRTAAIERSRREAEEEERRKKDKEQREAERLRRDLEQREREDLERLKKEIAEKSGTEVKAGDSADQGEEMNREALLTKQREDQIKAKREHEKKMQSLAKRMEYMERAIRDAERPLLQKQAEEHSSAAMENAKQKHLADLALKTTLREFETERTSFAEKIIEQVREDFNSRLGERRAELEKEREEEELAREREAALEEKRRQEEDEKRRQEQIAREQAEEKARIEAEQRAEEEAERIRVEERKRQKELEAEERLAAQRNSASRAYAPPSRQPAWGQRTGTMAGGTERPVGAAYGRPAAGAPPGQRPGLFGRDRTQERAAAPPPSSDGRPAGRRPLFFNSQKGDEK